MTLEEKIGAATALIKARVKTSTSPILCISFGKDSMVMLDLFLRSGFTLPVIYWKREHHFPKKNKFSNEMIEKYDLEVYDYPPEFLRLIRKGDLIEVVNYFSIGTEQIAVPSGIVPYKQGEKYLCALEDMYLKPTGRYNFPWDTMFIGHKDTDVDPVQGAVPLLADESKVQNGPMLSFPIRHFTDEDIWEYTKRFEVPQDTRRYKDGREDVDYNNDYYPACTDCMNPGNPSTIHCPKFKTDVPNVSGRLVWADSIRPAYWGQDAN